MTLSLIHPSSEPIVLLFQDVQITAEERKLIQEDTQSQSQGSSFYRHRAGRVGASISKAASHTNSAEPSPSLIKQSVTQIFLSLAMQPHNTVVNMRVLQLKPMKRS